MMEVGIGVKNSQTNTIFVGVMLENVVSLTIFQLFQSIAMSEVGEVKEKAWMSLVKSGYQLITGIGLGILIAFTFIIFRMFKRPFAFLLFILIIVI